MNEKKGTLYELKKEGKRQERLCVCVCERERERETVRR